MSDVFKKEQNRDGKIELTEYNGNTTKVLIPDDVYEIGWEVFKDHTEVEEVVFPEGLEVIGYGAFEGCTGLKEVRFPNSIGSIDVGAFSDCTSLEKAEFSETHKSELWDLLGSSAFSGCSSLKEFRIPAESGNIPGNLFEGCDSLEKVIIEDRSVLILGKKPRDVCEPLKNAALPQQLDSPELKRDVMAYAAKNILAGDCDDEYKDAWIKYIKSQRKPCFEQIKGNKSLSELVIKEKILKPEELGAEPEKKEVISYDISYKEARSRYNFSKRNTGYSINDFNKDGRIDGPLLPDYNYVFSKYAEDKSKTVFIPNTIDGKPVGHVAVKTLPFDAVVLCDAATFSKLDRKVKASTSVAYLEDSTPFKEDEAGKILEFIRKNPLDVAKALTSSDSPAAFSRYLELGKPKKDTIGQIIDSVKDKKEIVAILLNASGMEQGAPELDLAPKKQLSVAEIKKEWNYDKRDLEINGEWVTGIYLKKYKGIDPNVEVLDIIGKAPVLAVGAGAFEGNTGIESVTVPACVKIIERNAFKGCSNLRSVRILGENVVIGDNAFCDCSSFEEIVIDASTTKFGNHPFKGCTKMLDDKGLVILEAEEGNVLVDSKWPFDYSEITVPEGVVRIDGQAFADQTEGWKTEKENLILRRVILPSTIKEIGNSVFEGCEILQSVEMPEGLEKIRERAFRGCKMLREMHIPKSVTEIEVYNYHWTPFDGLKDLTLFGYEGTEAEKFAEEKKFPFVIEDPDQPRKDLVVDFVIDDGVLTRYLGKDSEVVIPEGIKSIGYNAFGHNQTITSAVVPKGVIEIGEYAFSGCTKLVTVTLPDGLLNIEQAAFQFCYQLKEIVLPEGLMKIGRASLSYSGIEKIVIPESVEEIGEDAFLQCDKLNTVINHSAVAIPVN